MAAEAFRFWRGFDENHRLAAAAALWHAQALIEAGAGGQAAQALREAEVSVEASGGLKEQAWLERLKRRLAVGATRKSGG